MTQPVMESSKDRTKITIKPVPGDPLVELGELGAKRQSSLGRAWEFPAVTWLKRWANDLVGPVKDHTVDLWHPTELEVQDDPRWDKLYDFQKLEVGKLVATYDHPLYRGRMEVLSPGLGKTVIAVTAVDMTPATRILVLCPSSLVPTWQRHIAEWAEFKRIVLPSKSGETIGWTITTYEQVANHPEYFVGVYDIMILDESVKVKTRDSQRTKAVMNLRKRKKNPVRVVWELSASPTTRFQDDAWAQLHILHPIGYTSFWRFAHRYCYTEPNAWGPGETVVGDRRNQDPLADAPELVSVVNQRDVLDLPEYLFETIDVRPGPQQRKAYADMLKEFYVELGGVELNAANKAARMMRLLQIVSGLGMLDSDISAKTDVLVDLITSKMYEFPMHIWTHWRETGIRLHRKLIEAGVSAVLVNGTMTRGQQDAAIEGYKAGHWDVMIISMGVGKYGHTMTNSKTIAYHDRTFDADAYFQSLHRTRRIGLGHSPVVLTLRMPDTIEELVEENLEGKMGSIAKMTNADLFGLLAGLGIA